MSSLNRNAIWLPQVLRYTFVMRHKTAKDCRCNLLDLPELSRGGDVRWERNLCTRHDEV
jgi:hypothetical protein